MKNQKYITFLLLFIILTISLSTPYASGESLPVTLIYSSNRTPYTLIENGIRRFFTDKSIDISISSYNLKKQSPDVIYRKIETNAPKILFTIGTRATRFAVKKIKNSPVVFSMVLDPEKFLGPNVSGVSLNVPTEMKLEIVKEIIPQAKKAGIIYSQKSLPYYQETTEACKKLDFELISIKLEDKSEFPDAVNEISVKADFLLMVMDSTIYFSQSIKYLLTESLRHKLPVIGLSSLYTKAGALISFESDYNNIGRQAGELGLMKFKGHTSGRSSLVKPQKITFSLNMITADRMNITIPSEIINKASETFGK